MLTGRRIFLKYLALISILWFVATITFSFHSNSSSLPRSDNDIPINVVNKIVSMPSIVERIRKVFPFVHRNMENDHPFEERIKAHEQVKEMKAKVQVVAPPGKFHHERNASGPGEMGVRVRIDKDKLSPEERKLFDDGWQNNAFNQYASDMISVRRSLPDVRDPE